MEHRNEPRIPVEKTLTLRILGNAPSDIEVQVIDVSADGMRYLSPRAVAPSSAIRIDRPDGMILGEVCYCDPAPENQFHLGVLFHQVLNNLRNLDPLLRTLHPTHATKALKPSSR